MADEQAKDRVGARGQPKSPDDTPDVADDRAEIGGAEPEGFSRHNNVLSRDHGILDTAEEQGGALEGLERGAGALAQDGVAVQIHHEDEELTAISADVGLTGGEMQLLAHGGVEHADDRHLLLEGGGSRVAGDVEERGDRVLANRFVGVGADGAVGELGRDCRVGHRSRGGSAQGGGGHGRRRRVVSHDWEPR